MGRLAHRIYIGFLVTIVVVTTLVIFFMGTSYYQTSLEERFFHENHNLYKPSGLVGHGLGVFGTLLILIGVFGYMARKRWKSLSRLGLIKHWLEFHIFLCVLGPIMILAHTAFKFGGLVSISFWSMVAVVASGVVGRFIYIQIPRTLEGRELSLQEVKELKDNISDKIRDSTLIEGEHQLSLTGYGTLDLEGQNIMMRSLKRFAHERRVLREIKTELKNKKVGRQERRQVLDLVRGEMSLNRRISRLLTMQKLFRYWHVAHLPFAIVMLIIMIIHVIVTVTFGNKWIF